MEWLKRELFGGWTKFEAFWLLLFLGIQIAVFAVKPDSLAASIAAINGYFVRGVCREGQNQQLFFSD